MVARRKKKPSSHISKARTRRSARKRAASEAARPGQIGPKAKHAAEPKPITRRRLWLFRFTAAVVLPALLLGLLELALRIVGYGYPARAITSVRIDDARYGCDNARFSWRFFPRHLAREAAPYVFPATKPDGACRIFVLGASAAMGVPEPMFSFGRMLDVMLTDRYPGVRFEVVTTAMAAINSHVVLPIAKDAARYEPDLFVVYLGNNEVTGPYGAGTVFTPLSSNLSLIRTAIAFKGSRLGQLMTDAVGSLARTGSAPEMWRGLEMFQNHHVRADDPALQTVYRHFQRNLEDIVRIGRRAGAQVVLCTVAGNLKDCAPFDSLHRRNLSVAEKQQWEEIYAQGIAHEDAARRAEAIQAYLAAAEIDDRYADLQFRLGRCYWTLGQYNNATQRYVRARELDTLRFRADNNINEIIRDVAARNDDGVHLADTVDRLAEHSPEQTAGHELFHEHVHLNFTGNYRLAELVLERVEKTLPERIKHLRADDVEPLTEAEVAQRLAYTARDRYKVADKVLNSFIKRPPFSSRLYHQEQITRLERKLALLKAQVDASALEQAAQCHLQAIEARPEDWVLRWKYGQFLMEAANGHRAALAQFRWVRDHLPHSWLAHNSLAGALYAAGDLDGAIVEYGKTIQLQPTCGRAHFFVGEAWQRRGDIEKAMTHYAEAIRWEPDCLPAYNNMARELAGKGKLDQAIDICRRGLVFCPNSAVLHASLGTLLARSGQRTEAIAEYRAALAINPNLTQVAESLGLLLKTSR
jgi:tetratricopeptide (TPR) repeat protein